MRILYTLLLFLLPALAQVPLPKTPWIPPVADVGARPSPQNHLPNPHWSALLGSLLYFYEAQRSGKLPETKRVAWRNDSALTDGKGNGIDLTGGYYDAGDYIKATYPLSFAIMSICWGATDFGKGYDLADQTPYLDDMLRWGLNWLMKAHPSNDTLYVLVSDPQTDGDYWGGDQHIPAPRNIYQINATSPGTDAAAAASAAFSACSALYSSRAFPPPFLQPATLANASYASTLLLHATQLYAFAVNASGGQRTYTKSVPTAAASYPSESYDSDLALAAAFLARAENSTARWDEARALFDDMELNTTFGWASKGPGVAVLMAQMTLPGGSGEVAADKNRSRWQDTAEKYFDAVLNRRSHGGTTPGGLLFYEGDSNEASLNPALNAAMLLTRYAQIATTLERKTTYLDYAKSQLDYVLGNNPMRVPYIVGINPNSPSNPHSAPASGGNDISAINTSPPQEAYVLYGAVVGGPDRRDRFWDIRSDWPQTEVALDYNAPMLTLTAMHLSNTSTENARDPVFASIPPGSYAQRRPRGLPCDRAFPEECGPSKMSRRSAIAVGVVISIVGFAVLCAIAWWVWEIRRHAAPPPA